MAIIKSISVGNGDTYYIKHGNDNFTIIDCCMDEDNKKRITNEIINEKAGKTITRFISTHPDDDHILGLEYLHNKIDILNFYCVKNEVPKEDENNDLELYCNLRDDPEKSFHIYKGCSRKWMNLSDEQRGASGIHILWPVTDNKHYKKALEEAKDGKSPNNISPIIQYSIGNMVVIWMGDLLTDFMDNISDELDLPKTTILFAPHHGRDRIPQILLDAMEPEVIIIGEAPSDFLVYYSNYNTITQNSTGDITMEINGEKVDFYVSNNDYSVDFLEDESISSNIGKYIGTLY